MAYGNLLLPGVGEGVDTVDLEVDTGEVEGSAHPRYGLLDVDLLLNDLRVRALQHLISCSLLFNLNIIFIITMEEDNQADTHEL